MWDVEKINLELIKDWYEWNGADFKGWDAERYLKGSKENWTGNRKSQ